MRHPIRRSPVICALVLSLSVPVGAALAQAPASLAPRSVVALDVALYTAGANLQEASDSARAALATTVLRGRLAELLGPALADSVAVRRLRIRPGSAAHRD